MDSANKTLEQPMADQPQTLSPVGRQRLISLDFIRGIAVMGILGANIVSFGQPFGAYMYPDSFLTPHGEAEGWMWVVQFVFIDAKMRGLFTVLFGAGMMLFLEKAWARGASNWLQARRLGWLLMFGLIHFFLIWRGDILALYAMVGLLALAFTHLAARQQMIVGLLIYLAGVILFAVMMVPLHLIADTDLGSSAMMAETVQELELGRLKQLTDDAQETNLLQSGNYAGFVAHNFSQHAWDPFVTAFTFFLETLPLMVIGMALYRLGLFDGRMMDEATQRRRGWIMLVAGAAISLAIALWVRSTGFTFYGTMAAFVGLAPIPQLLMTLGLLFLLSLWAKRATGWLGQRVVAAGRAAFSNYLGTSILMMFVFHGWALGLFGELTRAGLYVVMVLTWVVMLAWSKPWLDHFRYGPLEWLWRCLTYGKLFPIKK